MKYMTLDLYFMLFDVVQDDKCSVVKAVLRNFPSWMRKDQQEEVCST